MTDAIADAADRAEPETGEVIAPPTIAEGDPPDPPPAPASGAGGDDPVARRPSAVTERRFDSSEESEIRARVRRAAGLARDPGSLLRRAEEALASSGFLRPREAEGNLVLTAPAPAEGEEVWFVGDLHGDLLGLEAALWVADAEAAAAGRRAHVVLLGDLVDRGDDGAEVFLRVLELALERPGRLTLLAGNHDVEVAWDERAGKFVSGTSPAEFVDWLNEVSAAESEQRHRIGRLFETVANRLPRAIFFGDGQYAAHGGIVHSDQHETIGSLEDLEREICLQDLVWLRAHETAPNKRCGRQSKGMEFGVRNFERFCEVASQALGRPVERLIRGHDHFEDRHFLYPEYGGRVVAINTMSYRQEGEFAKRYALAPCVARYRTSEPLCVVRLLLSEGLVREIHPHAWGCDRALASLKGLAVGDALGAWSEGSRFIEGRRRSRRLDGPLDGEEWTDDTEMAVSLLEVLLARGTVDQDLLATRFASRFGADRGYGRGMRRWVELVRDGRSWRDASLAIFPGGSFGNGAAMRAAPLGAFLRDSQREHVVQEATLSAEVTHAHPEARAGAVAVAVAAWLAARGRGPDTDKPGPAPAAAWMFEQTLKVAEVDGAVRDGVAEAATLGTDVSLAEAVERLGNGSQVSARDTVPLALWIAFSHLDDFDGAVRLAIDAGGDTDTLAAIAGGIVAARVGPEGIPAAWLAAVEPLPDLFALRREGT